MRGLYEPFKVHPYGRLSRLFVIVELGLGVLEPGEKEGPRKQFQASEKAAYFCCSW